MAESPQFQHAPLNPQEAAAHEEINAEIRNNRPRNNANNTNNANNNGNQQPVSVPILFRAHVNFISIYLFFLEPTD